MTKTRVAIPLAIELILTDREPTVPASLLLDRLTRSFDLINVNRERGRREVLARRDELIALRTPEVLLTGMPLQAERTTAVSIRWEVWPGNFVAGHIFDMNPILDGPSFELEHQDFAFASFDVAQFLGFRAEGPAIYAARSIGLVDGAEAWFDQRHDGLSSNRRAVGHLAVLANCLRSPTRLG